MKYRADMVSFFYREHQQPVFEMEVFDAGSSATLCFAHAYLPILSATFVPRFTIC